jgi:hypothetical protein
MLKDHEEVSNFDQEEDHAETVNSHYFDQPCMPILVPKINE